MIDPDSNKSTNTLLENTNELIHSSVRARYGLPHLGIDDKGSYRPGSLKHWRLVEESAEDGVLANTEDHRSFAWLYDGSDSRFRSAQRILREDVLGEFELELLRQDPAAYARVLESLPQQQALQKVPSPGSSTL